MYKTSHEIITELTEIRYDIMSYSDDQLTELVVKIFEPDITESPDVMMLVQWFQMYALIDIGKTALRLHSTNGCLFPLNLTMYKFKIICGYRGPLTVDGFDSYYSDLLIRDEELGTETPLIKIAKHKDFSATLRLMMYTKTNDPSYLPQGALGTFIF